MTNDQASFIADQGLRLLMADDPRPHLLPEAFRGSRTGPRELPGSGGPEEDPWQPVDRDAVALDRLHDAGPGPIPLHRLVVTSDAGIGKSTLLDWMLYRNHRADSNCMAFGLVLGGPVSAGGQASRRASLATDRPADGDQLLERVLVPRVCRSLPAWNAADQQRVHRVLQRLRDQGRLVLLFDGLDQASGDGAAVRLLQDLLADRRWQKCRIVVSGRPHALQRYWNELFAAPAIGWRYLQADEFTERQQRAYLGQDASGQDRYERLPEEAREILGVPRVLEYLRRLDDDQWSKIRTASDVYWLSIRQLVLSGLQNSAEARRLGLLPGEATPDQALRRQFDRAMELLGAIAFQMTATMIRREAGRKVGGRPRDHLPVLFYRNVPTPTEIPNFDRITPHQMPWFRRRVITRVKGKRFEDISEQDARLLELDLDCLAAMNDVLSQGLLDVARESGGGLSQVLWRNRTLQEFFTAHWLANHATSELGDQLWDWIYRPQDPHSAEYYWVWRFLTEMPGEALEGPESWLQAIEPLYRPGNGRAEDTKRSSEMIYRSWSRLHALAEKEDATAERVRSAFLGEFEQIRAGRWEHNTEEGKRRAEEFIGSFLEIPAGWFHVRGRLGSPPEILAAGTFLLSNSPTTIAWYRLFDPEHMDRLVECVDGFIEVPVDYVSWYDAWTFCVWSRWDGQSCRLPEVREWEYAASGGTPRDMDSLGGRNRYGPVNMLDNIYQWCASRYEVSKLCSPSCRAARGGSWYHFMFLDGGPCRRGYVPWWLTEGLGFRVARVVRKS
jgi:hypothetical protein